MSNMELFLFCFKRGFQSLALEILTDVIITHPSVIAPKPADADTSADPEAPPALKPNALLKPIMKAFLKAFESDNPDVSQVACIGASKFLLMNILPSASAAELLKAFTLRYFNPETAANPALRQSLSYVLPVFCHSRQQNARLMAQIAVPVIQKLQFMREEVAADEELDDMVGWPVVAGHLAEWTDGRQVVGATELGLDGKMSNVEGAEDAHLLLAIDVLERALQHRDERKPLLTLLGKLHVSSSPAKGETGDEERLRTLHALAAEAVEGNIGTDATSRNFLVKLEAALSKRIGDLEISTKVEDGGKEETDVETANEAEADDADVADSKPASRGTTAETDAELEEEEEDDGLEEDTMLAGVHAEGTRMPLEDDEEDEGEEEEDVEAGAEETMTTIVVGRTKGLAVTEDDIVESLLESEISE
jgi:condensin complex subunit 3